VWIVSSVLYRDVGALTLCSPVATVYAPPGLTCSNSTFCPHSVFMCFVWISEQTMIVSLYNINWLGFISEAEFVYCAVRTEVRLAITCSLD
jgi:hypothetical protein